MCRYVLAISAKSHQDDEEDVFLDGVVVTFQVHLLPVACHLLVHDRKYIYQSLPSAQRDAKSSGASCDCFEACLIQFR